MTSQVNLKMASAEVVETSVANNGPFLNFSHPDDHFQSRCVTLEFKLFFLFIIIIVYLLHLMS